LLWVTYPGGKNVKCGLIIMGDLPRWKIEKIWSGLIVMGDLPKWKECDVRSHYNGWPTQMEDRKNVKRSRYNGWPTQVEDRKNVKWSRYNGWPTQKKWCFFFQKKMVSLLRVTYPNGKNVTYLAKRLGWSSPDRTRLRNLAPSGCRLTWRLLDDGVNLLVSLRFSYWQGSSHSLLVPGSKPIICHHQLNDSFFVHKLAGLHWGSFCNKSQVCAMLWG